MRGNHVGERVNDSSDNVALVIGAGPGLGAGLARRFAHAGIRVAVESRNTGNAETLAAKLICIVFTVIPSYPSMVVTHNKMRAAVVPTNNRMKRSFAGPGISHGS